MSEKKPVKSKAKNEIDTSTQEDDKVELKSVLGIKPGYYLACLYGAALLVILFFILFYPGIKNPGSVITVNSEPWGAAVLVDGAYMGAAPCEVFVKQGHRTIELRLPGFLPKQIEKDIGGRIFASLINPLKTEIREKLESPNPIKAFGEYASEYAAWSFAGEPSIVYQIPMVLSEGAYRLGPESENPVIYKSMEDTIAASGSFAVTRSGLRDLIRAKTLIDNRGISPSPLSLLGSAQEAISFLDKNPMAALWLGSVLNGDALSELTSSSWYTETAMSAAAAKAQNDEEPRADYTPDNITLIQAGPLTFRLVHGGKLSGINFPAGKTVDQFFISETAISVTAWERFLEANPRWRIENTDTLINEGLVKEEYLNLFGIKRDSPEYSAPSDPLSRSPAGPAAETVSGISWFAAKAFCQWLNSYLPSQYSSWEARLPSEAEWEYAAGTGLSNSYMNDSGNYWEWCEDPFIPLNFLSIPDSASVPDSPERAVRGGSWVNQGRGVTAQTRGSLPPSFCSPFVSARPVIAPRAAPAGPNQGEAYGNQ